MDNWQLTCQILFLAAWSGWQTRFSGHAVADLSAVLIEKEVSRSAGSIFPKKFWKFFIDGARRRFAGARFLEKYLDTPAKIYYKDESTSQPEVTSPIRRWPRHGTTNRLA
jgi:hypothetical protein